MPLGEFEQQVLRLLAGNRRPDSYVAGATVYLRRADSPRQSQDIDVFHDSAESLETATDRDERVLLAEGYGIEWVDEQETYRRAVVSQGEAKTKIEWAYDSPFRFFPVQPDPELGYVLHPLDSATNKLLALAGRGELRDYLDVLFLDRQVLGLGALAWAACGKDNGYTPEFLLEEAQRLAHFPAARWASLRLREPVDPVECKQHWLQSLAAAKTLFPRLPISEIGCLYMDEQGQAVVPKPGDADFARLRRHFGSFGGQPMN